MSRLPEDLLLTKERLEMTSTKAKSNFHDGCYKSSILLQIESVFLDKATLKCYLQNDARDTQETSQVRDKGFFLYEAGAAGAWPPCTLEIPIAMRSAKSCLTAAS